MKIGAYLAGCRCNKFSKTVPSKIYHYKKEQLYYFLSAILNSRDCLILEDKVIYPAKNFSYLYMLKKRFQDAGIEAAVNYDLDFRCVMINLSEILYNEHLHLNKNYKKLRRF